MDNLDFSDLTDDQLVDLFRAVCQEAVSRNPAVAAAVQSAGLDEAEKSRVAAQAAEREAAAQRARERQRVAEEAAAKVREAAETARSAGERAAAAERAAKEAEEAIAMERRRKQRLARIAELVGRSPADISFVAYAGTLYVNEGHNKYNRDHLVRYTIGGKIETCRPLISRKPEIVKYLAELAQIPAYRSGSAFLSGADYDWTNEQAAASAT